MPAMHETNNKVSEVAALWLLRIARSSVMLFRTNYTQILNCLVQMLVHGSDDFPDETATEKVLPVGRELLFRVTPTSGYRTEAVRQVAPSSRQCVFESEMKLKYFPVYSEINWITECRMDYTIHHCKCSHFYYHDTGKCGSVHDTDDSVITHTCSAHATSSISFYPRCW
jgi:hypothetical protein